MAHTDIRTIPGFSPAMTADERVALVDAWDASRAAKCPCDDCQGREEHTVTCTDRDHTAHRHHQGMCEDEGFREVAQPVSLDKPFPKGARVSWQPTYGRTYEGVIVGQRFTGQWWVRLDGRTKLVSGGTPQLTLI